MIGVRMVIVIIRRRVMVRSVIIIVVVIKRVTMITTIGLIDGPTTMVRVVV